MSALERRTYEVVKTVRESDSIKSLYLAPADKKPIQSFKPGQFLTFELEISGCDNKVVRNYSVSNWPSSDRELLRVSIKREDAPQGKDVPAGLGSGYMHDEVVVGSKLVAMGPAGQFFLKGDTKAPVVLLSGGVGITPMMAMAHALAADSERETYFIHACDSSRVQAFSAEIKQLCSASSNIKSHICYRFPASADVLGDDYHSEGFLTKNTLKSILPLDDYDFYMCGPPAFMQAIYLLLLDLGVEEERINYEFFGPATLLKPKHDDVVASKPAVAAAFHIASSSKIADSVVTFSRSNIQVNWSDEFDSLLELAEANGIAADFGCRIGICSECKCEIKSGDVDYFSDPLDMPEPGEILPCCSKPVGNVELDL